MHGTTVKLVFYFTWWFLVVCVCWKVTILWYVTPWVWHKFTDASNSLTWIRRQKVPPQCLYISTSPSCAKSKYHSVTEVTAWSLALCLFWSIIDRRTIGLGNYKAVSEGWLITGPTLAIVRYIRYHEKIVKKISESKLEGRIGRPIWDGWNMLKKMH
jgi:hypothetical protein